MRIIAGLYRGRRILPPLGRTTRPITDRVKESLFGILSGQVEGARVADIFAGTGSLGLEALSREAESCCFVESDRRALRLLRQNVQALGVEERARIAAKNAWLFPSWSAHRQPFELIFVDPPYVDSRDSELSSRLGKLLAGLSGSGILSSGGIVVLRHEAAYPCGTDYEQLQLSQTRCYGAMALSIFVRSAQG